MAHFVGNDSGFLHGASADNAEYYYNTTNIHQSAMTSNNSDFFIPNDTDIGNNNSGDFRSYQDFLDNYYDNADYTIPEEEIVPVVIVYGLTFLLGATGNALVIFSIARFRRMQSVTNIFLLSLSSADLLVVLICVPVKLAKWFSFTWDFGEFMCKAVHYLQNLSLICSVLTLTVISLERYYAIIHPMRAKLVCTKQKARMVVMLVWALSAVFSLPIIFGQSHVLKGIHKKGYWCYKVWPSPVVEKIYEVGMLTLVLIVPLIVMMFSYLSICYELWILTYRHRANKETSCRSNGCHVFSRGHPSGVTRLRSFGNEETSRKQVIKMLVAIILIFVICWAPCLIDNVLVAFGVLDKLHYGPLKPMRQAFVIMSYFNSCVNPMVYAFMSRNFRDTFRYALCMCVNKEGVRKRRYERQSVTKSSVYVSGTRNTNTRETLHEQFDDDIDLGCGITAATFRSYSSDKNTSEAYSFL